LERGIAGEAEALDDETAPADDACGANRASAEDDDDEAVSEEVGPAVIAWTGEGAGSAPAAGAACGK